MKKIMIEFVLSVFVWIFLGYVLEKTDQYFNKKIFDMKTDTDNYNTSLKAYFEDLNRSKKQ